MTNLGTEQVLALVQRALAEIDDRPIDVTARRAARIASLLGETEFAVYLAFELRPSGGFPQANAEDTRRLMADPSLWGDPDGPVEAALNTYIEMRRSNSFELEGDKVPNHGLAEVEWVIAAIDGDAEAAASRSAMETRNAMHALRERVRHRIFAALCAWERQLTYANVNERIFDRFRSRVDALLAAGAPAILDQFSAAHRRLREAAANPTKPVAEDLAQAVTTCRRILKAVADHLLPGVPNATSAEGKSLNDAAYRNRIFEYIKSNVDSDTTAGTVEAAVGGLFERFTATDKLASKGVHADVGLAEAELCAIHTYLLAGELLAIAEATATT